MAHKLFYVNVKKVWVTSLHINLFKLKRHVSLKYIRYSVKIPIQICLWSDLIWSEYKLLAKLFRSPLTLVRRSSFSQKKNDNFTQPLLFFFFSNFLPSFFSFHYPNIVHQTAILTYQTKHEFNTVFANLNKIVITLVHVNHKGATECTLNTSKLKVSTCGWCRKTRESPSAWGLPPDWITKGREFFKPIASDGDAKLHALITSCK